MFSLSGLSPADGKRSVALSSLIEFTIIDDGNGIDSSSLKVDISGVRAIEDLSFKAPYNGTYSEINPIGDNLSIVIDPEADFKAGSVVEVKVQVKNLSGSYFNTNYVFALLKKEPEIVITSPAHGDIVRSHQVLHLQFEDKIDDMDMGNVNIEIDGLVVIKDGTPQEGFTESGISDVKKVTDGVIVKIDPDEHFRNGDYSLKYSVADTSGNKLVGSINFKVNVPVIALPSIFPQSSFVGRAGVKQVSDQGYGDTLKVEWNTPRARSYKADVFALIYHDKDRLKIFDSLPKYIAKKTITSVDIKGFTPGVTLSFAVRAMETFSGSLSTSGMDLIDGGIYKIPAETKISQVVSAEDTVVFVDSVSGYPNKGFLVLGGTEVVKYISKSEENNAFYLAAKGRGLSGTKASVHIKEDPAKMFLNCQDTNEVIVMATPTYQDGYVSGREVDNVGLVVNDYTDNDKKFFEGFDFCGYHQAMPSNILANADDCPSYLGGEFNGMRGMNLFDRMLNREEVLLDQVGEPVILLRRLWNGQTCSCVNTRRAHPKVKSCKACYGTGYVNGYSQYDNLRRGDGRCMVSFADTVEDLKLGAHEHLEQVYEPSCWTLPAPAIRDRDLIVRFDFTGDLEYIYEVLDVAREKLFFKHYTRQKLRLKRMDKTDIVYTIKYNL